MRQMDQKILPSAINASEKEGDNLDATLTNAGLTVEEKEIKSDVFEATRLKVKKFMTTSTFGLVYEKVLLFLSILSTIEYIYSTYLDANKPYMAIQLFYLEYIEMSWAGIFGLDWILAFLIADHKLTFIKR